MIFRHEQDTPQETFSIQNGTGENSAAVAKLDTANSSVPALRDHPSRLFVETTTRCNLRCGMCMKQTSGNGIVEGDMHPDTFARLTSALPHCEALILNGIGEPLLHRQLETFIRQARTLMPAEGWIGFQSNGLLVCETRAISLVEAGLDRICLSLDAVTPDTFRRIREGGEVNDLERALTALRRAREILASPLRIGTEFVVMRENARELPAALRWAAEHGANFAIVSHLLPYEKEHAGSVAHETNSDEAIAFFEPWRRRAEREGLDLRRFFKVILNYLRSPEDQRVVDFVWEMRKEARSRNLFINLKNLLERDEEWAGEIGAIFAEAEQVARETGLELALPAITPRGKRRCDFVENGGAFVSWDGGVHACYFLWHQFSCYSSGSRKFVQPKVFGNLNQTSMGDIWNDPHFREYRREVLAREYPVCSNCNLVPCEYMYTESFEQDCYAGTVPCGDCLWNMGLFRCLQ
jgi:putative metalloenzyme radical SAM/SPASM domain maturase